MLRRMRALVVAVIGLGCSHPPPPKPVAAEKPVTSFADVDGEWVTSDDMDFGYHLYLKQTGDLFLDTDRGKLGRCTLHGHMIAGATSPKFELEASLDECHRDRPPGTFYVTFSSFTGDHLTVEITDNDGSTRRTYTARAFGTVVRSVQ